MKRTPGTYYDFRVSVSRRLSATVLCVALFLICPLQGAPFGQGFSGYTITRIFRYSAQLQPGVPAIPISYGAVTIDPANPNRLVMAGSVKGSGGALYAVNVNRDASQRIAGLTGVATRFASTPGVDAGAAFGPGSVLFYSIYAGSAGIDVGMIKPGSAATNKTVDIVPSTPGSLGFVPPGFPGAGKLKLLTYLGRFNTVPFTPDNSGTFNLSSAVLETSLPLLQPTGGFAYVKGGSPGFAVDSLVVAELQAGVITAYEVDVNGNPKPATRRVFFSDPSFLTAPIGLHIDPVAGDLIVTTAAGSSSAIYRISGFSRGESGAPVLTVSPEDGSVLPTTTPSISISYADASGLDLSTFAVTIDGIDYKPQFSVGPSSATAQPSLSGGQHVIIASIKDTAGNLGQITTRFTISSFQSLPTATPTSGPIPLTVKFKANAIYTGGPITQWRWDFQGDGIFDTSDIGPLDYTSTFTKTGVFNAVLEVTNDKGQKSVGTVQITATNQPASASASVDPSNGGLPLTVTLTGTGVSPNGTIVKYEWDRFGTGTFDYSSTTSGTTTATYTQEGTYNAVFRVTDNFGQTATALATATAIRVGPAGSPTATIVTPTGPVTGNAPLNRTFNGAGTASAGRTITKYEWDFDGDGTFDVSSASSGGASFTYTTPGVFTVAFRVTDNTGATGTDTLNVTVNLPATLTLSTDTLKVAQNGTVDIRTTIGGTVPVTIFLKNKGGQTVRTLVNNVTRAAGSYTDTWDGKNDAGVLVPDAVYYAVLRYRIGANTIDLDLTNTADTFPVAPSWTSKLSSSGQGCTFTYFFCKVNPFNDDFFQADFTLSQALELSLDIRQINTTLQIVQLFDRRPFGRNTPYSLFWDGTDASGKPLETPSFDGYLWGLIGYRLPANGVYVEDRPTLAGITATPNYFDPSTGDFISPSNPTTKISYSLSKPALLSLQVFRSGSNILLRTITQNGAAGPGTIEWNGRADNGLFADNGDYHIALKAVDAAGNQSIVRYVSVRVYY